MNTPTAKKLSWYDKAHAPRRVPAIHQLVLIAMGMPIFDNCDLEAVSEEAAPQNRGEFLLTAAPIRVVGGTGSPLNPIATF